MHVHLPKPIHGWREFVGEVGIIVIGVLIALGAEYLIEQWHWREKADTASEAFRDELQGAAGYAYERLIIQPCLQSRIRDLASQLGEDTEQWKGSRMEAHNKLFLNVLPAVYRAPSREFPTDGWKNAIANGTLDHLPSADVRRLSFLYGQVADLSTGQEAEANAAARLTPLAFDRKLGETSRTQILASLAEVDRINSAMALTAHQIIEDLRGLHLKYPVAEVEAGRREIVRIQTETRGACVANLPLDMG